MSLPTTFAALTQATGAQLDANFAALGALTPIPCAVTGTSSLVLTPGSNTPTQTAYSNYKQFTGIVSVTNPGAVTARVGAFAALNIYKDGPAGPVVLTGGELVANCAFVIMYDSALNSGSGGWHLMSSGDTMRAGGGTFTGTVYGATFSVASVFASTAVSAPQINATTGASIAALRIAAGQQLARLFSTVSSISLGAVLPGGVSTSAIALPGVSVGDVVDLGLPATVSTGLVWNGYVSANDTITLRVQNLTPSTTITPPAGNYRVASMGFS